MASFLAIISTRQGEKLSGSFLVLVNGLLPEWFDRTIGNMDFLKYEVEETALTAQRQKVEGIREKGFWPGSKAATKSFRKKNHSGVSEKKRIQA